MNQAQRTIALPADTLAFSITFQDPMSQALAGRVGQAEGQAASTQTADTAGADTAGAVDLGETAATGDTGDQAPALRDYCDADDVIEAIRSDARFTQRSMAAIQKYLSHIDPQVVTERVNTMRLEDELTSRTRRSGETVYSVAG